MMKILIVHNKAGECAAYRLEELICKHNQSNDFNYNSITVIHWGENQWEDNQFTNIENKKIFIGDIKSVESIKKISKSKSLNYGVTYSILGEYAIITADSKGLLSSQSDYDHFLQDLQEMSPNNIDHITHGKKKLISFMKGGIKKMLDERYNVQEQQLLYGATVFFKKDFNNYIKDSTNDSI